MRPPKWTSIGFGVFAAIINSAVAAAGVNYLPRNSGLLYGLFPYFGKCFYGVTGVEADSLGPLHEFDHFDELLSGLDVADVILSAFKALCEINLPKARLLAFFNQEIAQRFLSGRIDGPGHQRMLNG